MRSSIYLSRLIALWLVVTVPVLATKIAPTPLAKQVEVAAVIAFGRVERVTIHDDTGRELSNPSARTGPGISNELRLHVLLDSKRVLKGEVPSSGLRATFHLWKGWHNSLSASRDAYEKKEFIFFLSADLRPSFVPEFVHFHFEESEILPLIRKPKKPNKAPEPTTTAVTSPAAQETRQP